MFGYDKFVALTSGGEAADAAVKIARKKEKNKKKNKKKKEKAKVKKKKLMEAKPPKDILPCLDTVLARIETLEKMND